jgi:hypothetical protein
MLHKSMHTQKPALQLDQLDQVCDARCVALEKSSKS